MVDIFLAASRPGKYPQLATTSLVNNCYVHLHKRFGTFCRGSANELAFIFNDHFHNPCELHPHFYFSDCVRICYKKSCQVWLCTKIRTKALIYCCSSLAINTSFPNNRCLLVVFTTALLLPSAVINLIPILYPKQLRAIADTKYYLHPSKVILLHYYY